MKQVLGIAASLIFSSVSAQASTMYFNNNSGIYSAGGVAATVTVSTSSAGGSLYYNNVEDAIGVGTSNSNGALGLKEIVALIPQFTSDETITVTFNREVTVNTVWFRQWENKVLSKGDMARFDYSGGTSGSGTLIFSDSGLGDGLGVLLDPFAAGVSLTRFTLTPKQGFAKANGATSATAIYLHSIDFSTAEVPVPAAVWLFGSALIGLAGVARKRNMH